MENINHVQYTNKDGLMVSKCIISYPNGNRYVGETVQHPSDEAIPEKGARIAELKARRLAYIDTLKCKRELYREQEEIIAAYVEAIHKRKDKVRHLGDKIMSCVEELDKIEMEIEELVK